MQHTVKPVENGLDSIILFKYTLSSLTQPQIYSQPASAFVDEFLSLADEALLRLRINQAQAAEKGQVI
jgi:hypothetical protein